jgi:hypothetical protein
MSLVQLTNKKEWRLVAAKFGMTLTKPCRLRDKFRDKVLPMYGYSPGEEVLDLTGD